MSDHSTDPWQDYEEDERRYREATAEAEEAVAQALRAAPELKAQLDDWQRLVVENADVEFPIELTLTQSGPCLDAKQWPWARDLARVLARWHNARETLERARHILPDHLRDRLPPPPWPT